MSLEAKCWCLILISSSEIEKVMIDTWRENEVQLILEFTH